MQIVKEIKFVAAIATLNVSLIITRLVRFNISSSKELQEKLVFMDFVQMKTQAPVEQQLVNLFTYTATLKSLKKQIEKSKK